MSAQDQQDVMAIQTILRTHAGFNHDINGVRTPAMRTAMNRFLNLARHPGNNLQDSVMDLQRILERRAGYTAGIDGDAGQGTRSAAQRFMNLRGPGLNVSRDLDVDPDAPTGPRGRLTEAQLRAQARRQLDLDPDAPRAPTRGVPTRVAARNLDVDPDASRAPVRTATATALRELDIDPDAPRAVVRRPGARV